MKHLGLIIIVSIIALLAGYGGGKVAAPKNTLQTLVTDKETAFDRVMRTKELRCGYNIWPPAVSVDANTGKINGFIPEMVEYVAASIGIKVTWVQQAGWSSFPEDLKNRRFDAMCAGAWATKELAPYVAFTRPVFYNPVYAYAKASDTRFDAGLQTLNNPQYKIGGVDGAISAVIAKNDFPEAKIVGLPQLSDPSQVLSDLMYGKSDVVSWKAALLKNLSRKTLTKSGLSASIRIVLFHRL